MLLSDDVAAGGRYLTGSVGRVLYSTEVGRVYLRVVSLSPKLDIESTENKI